MKKMIPFFIIILQFTCLHYQPSFTMEKKSHIPNSTQKIIFPDRVPEFYKEICKKSKNYKSENPDNIKVSKNLLIIVSEAKNTSLIDEDTIAHYALQQKYDKKKNRFIYLCMQKIKAYNDLIKKEKKICPTMVMSEDNDEPFWLYKKWKYAQMVSDECCFNLTTEVKDSALLTFTKIDITIYAYKEFENLNNNLFSLQINPNTWHILTNMLLHKQYLEEKMVPLDQI